MTGRSTHAVRAVLGEPDFRRLLRVRLSGQLGDGLFQGALFSATFFNPQKATTAADAAAAFATLLLPYSLVGPFAGVLLDRWSRQRVLVAANVVRALVVAVLAGSVASVGATSGTTVALALVAVSVNRFVLSGLSASLPQVVEARRLVTANSFSTTFGSGATAVGGITSLALRAWWGEDDAGAARIALVGAASYLVSAGLARRIGVRRLGPSADLPAEELGAALRTVARGLVAGARHVVARPDASRAMVAITAHRFCLGLSFVGTLLLYTDNGYLHRGFTGLGQVLTGTVVGGFGAALVTPRATRALGAPRWIVANLGLAAVVEVALGLPYRHGSLVVAAVGLGFAAQAVKICVDTILQGSVDDAFRGRVFSFYDTLFNVSFVVAAGLAAVVVPDDGRSVPVLWAIAIGYLLTGLGYALATRPRAPRPALA